jgi:hypothetical protein
VPPAGAGRPACASLIGESELRDLAARLAAVDGIVGVLLGGSRARGEHTPESDVDLGLCYRPPLDVATLGELAREVSGPGAEVTAPGGWGPWVDGGGWLTIAGTAVDWLYRDLDRVHAAWADAQAGRYAFHAQAGHPLGVPDFAYAGEVALGVILADPTGELRQLHEQTQDYPKRLADALAEGLWEASFLLDIARKAVTRRDTTYIAGCLFRVVNLCAHALHGRAGRWLINEKGAVTAAGRLEVAPAGFTDQAHGLLAALGTGPDDLTAALDAAADLVAATRVACEWSS